MTPRRPWKVTVREPSGVTDEKEFDDLDDVALFVEHHRDLGNGVTVWNLPDGSKGRRYLDRALAPCRERHRRRL